MREAANSAEFRFYEELNDVLPVGRRKRSFVYAFSGQPAIKDAIEALGVPHTEVDLILVNSVSVGFDYRLQTGDRVSVYPVFESLEIGGVTPLRPRPLREPKFVCDVHLGKLARRLRLLGFDVAYRNLATDPELVETALTEQRILLTRDRGLLKLKQVTHGYLVRSPQVGEQVLEIIRRFDLLQRVQPFSRCTRCNGLLRPVAKAEVEDALPPKTREYCEEFHRCAVCSQVYWKGTHFRRLAAEVLQMIALSSDPGDRPVLTLP